MSLPKCSRVWIAEAIRDGRVKGGEREAFERHLPSCADCLKESRLLDELAEGLRGLPVAAPDALSARRQRQHLMAELDAARMGNIRSFWPRLAISLAVIAMSVGVVFVVGRSRKVPKGEPINEVAYSEPSIEVYGEAGARWRRTRSGDISRVELDEGTLSLRIGRRTRNGRVLIVVPDGEIEDFGTVLRVRVSEAHTAEVVVEEGNVAIRIAGLPEIRLGPGESWAPARPLDPPAVASAQTSHSRADTSRRARHEAHEADHGEVADAETRQSQDAEDLAYLQVVKLARGGKASEARALAREYLLRFPNGFRRVEMLDIATGSPESR